MMVGLPNFEPPETTGGLLAPRWLRVGLPNFDPPGSAGGLLVPRCRLVERSAGELPTPFADGAAPRLRRLSKDELPKVFVPPGTGGGTCPDRCKLFEPSAVLPGLLRFADD